MILNQFVIQIKREVSGDRTDMKDLPLSFKMCRAEVVRINVHAIVCLKKEQIQTDGYS